MEALKSRFKPTNIKKYRGDPTKIIARSNLERRVMAYLDRTSSILEWSSEEIVIPYISPVDNRPHRYFPDMWVRAIGRDGRPKVMILEIKPKSQTREPKKSTKRTKRYLTEVMTWGVNSAKWAAAQEYCADRGWEFKIITEEDLGITYK